MLDTAVFKDKDRDKEALFNVAYNETNNISSVVLLLRHNNIFIAPLWKSGGYIGFGLSVIPSVRSPIRLS